MAGSHCGILELSSARSAGPLNTRVCLRRPCVPVQVQQQRRLRHPHQQGQPLRWRGEPQRSLLFSSGSPVAPQLHLEVQGHGGGSTAAPLTARVSQRVAVGRSAAEVRPGPAHLTPPRPADAAPVRLRGAVAVPHAGRKRGGEERGAWWAGLEVRGGGGRVRRRACALRGLGFLQHARAALTAVGSIPALTAMGRRAAAFSLVAHRLQAQENFWAPCFALPHCRVSDGNRPPLSGTWFPSKARE